MRWPNDADGDVFRSLKEQGFDFDRHYVIDFNIDFESSRDLNMAMAAVRNIFPNATSIKNDGENPYIEIQIESLVEYDFVLSVQQKLSEEMEKYGGWCDSWGVLH